MASSLSTPYRMRFIARRLVTGTANKGDMSEAAFLLAEMADEVGTAFAQSRVDYLELVEQAAIRFLCELDELQRSGTLIGLQAFWGHE